MKKREFLKSLVAVGVASLLPVSVFSRVVENKLSSTINGIPAEITSFELNIRKILDSEKTGIISFKISVNEIFEAKLKVRGRVYHNIGDELKIKHLYSAYGYPSVTEVSGKISTIFTDKDGTHIVLTDCFGRVRMPEVQHINA